MTPDASLPPGYALIGWLQQFRHPVLDALFLAATALNSREFYIPALGALYWCVDRALAFRLANVLLATLWLNSALKHAFDLPRPDPRLVQVLVQETTPGLPSGHAQGATVFWGYLAAAGVVAAWAAVALILAISLSRLYLGVHFPLDLLAGWALGVVTLAAAWRLPSAWRRWGRAWPPLRDFAAEVATPVVAGLAMALLHRSPDSGGYVGALAGVGVGHAVGLRYVPFRPRAPLRAQVGKVLLGGLLLLVLRAAAKAVLPAGYWTDVLRYLLIGFGATAAMPWVFARWSPGGKALR